ncbi:MAG: 4-(cytidine 5'-diphospho)-2-C-methyl-D-erythritol kinase [Magnetococcales bacterium]|nr:4-(cytidine 5'-diphospho)-2-C-methyl-D-erythritol kinase [Magnetococcales bacterium]
MPAQPLTFAAPAKINLALRIVGRRPDGYHLLWTIMTFFPLYDRLTFTLLDHEQISVHCEPPVTDNPQENLVWRTARKLQQESGCRQGVAIDLVKQIPHGAGLGGGSSDAALTLLVLNRLWQLKQPLPQLLQLGVSLGADIPIFLGEMAALAEGIGERLTPLPHLPSLPMILIHPGCSLATATVFRQWHATRDPLQPYPTAPATLPTERQPLLHCLHNDLQSTAISLQPEIQTVQAALQQQGAVATLMSGSGTSVFGIFNDDKELNHIAQQLRQRHGHWRIFSGCSFNQHPFSSAWESVIRGVNL